MTKDRAIGRIERIRDEAGERGDTDTVTALSLLLGANVPTSTWQPMASAPRDGRPVWLWNKHSNEPIRFRWSTHYSVFGLGGCWTDGLCTMGDGVDFDYWCDVLPADYSAPGKPPIYGRPSCRSDWEGRGGPRDEA